MMTLSRMPSSFIAGDSLALSLPVGDYSAADGWAMALILTPIKGGSPVTVNASDGASEWALALTATDSAALAPVDHRFLIAATKGEGRVTIAHGTVEVQPDPAAADTDLRSPAQRGLDAIDAVLERRASSEDMKFTFEDGRAIDKIPHPELLELRKHYSRQVAREQNKGRGPRRVLVRL